MSQLRAEVERLRAELEASKGATLEVVQDLRSTCEDLGSTMNQLAAANALLQHIHDEHDDDQSLSVETLERLDDHLAGQTATPSGNYSLAELRRIVKAPPADLTGAERVTLAALREFCPERTTAEQRVLEAMTAWPEQDLRDPLDAPPDSQRQQAWICLVELCRAELARREGTDG